MNRLLKRGYQVHAKDYSGRDAHNVANSVSIWFGDPRLPERQMGWVTEPLTAYMRTMVRIAAHCRQQNGQGEGAS